MRIASAYPSPVLHIACLPKAGIINLHCRSAGNYPGDGRAYILLPDPLAGVYPAFYPGRVPPASPGPVLFFAAEETG